MEHIWIISDTHLTHPALDSHSLFPRQMARIPASKAWQAYDQIRFGIQDACDQVLRSINNGTLIHLGDVTGGWREQGMREDNLQQQAKHHVHLLRKKFDDLRFCLGGHDVGYSHRGSLPGSGINVEAVNNCREIFGDLWWLKECEGVCLLGICSPLANYTEKDRGLEKMHCKQERFIDEASHSIDGKPWILFAHDPFLPRIVRNLLRTQLPNCRAFIHGHRHNPWFTKLFRTLGVLRRDPFLRVSHTCPSVAPLWWRGCGMTEVIVDGKMVTIHDKLIDTPASVAQPPTASFFRCLWWMLRPR